MATAQRKKGTIEDALMHDLSEDSAAKGTMGTQDDLSARLPQERKREEKPLAYYFMREAGESLAVKIRETAQDAYERLDRFFWTYIGEPVGGCLSFNLKKGIEDRVGKERFDVVSATQKSYWLKGIAYGVAGYAASIHFLPMHDPPSADPLWYMIAGVIGFGSGMLGGFIECEVRKARSTKRFEHTYAQAYPEHRSSGRKGEHRIDWEVYPYLSGDPILGTVSAVYEGIAGTFSWFGEMGERARTVKEEEESGKVPKPTQNSDLANRR